MATITHRDRVLTALDHREPDRVPKDLGGAGPTAIHVAAYARLVKHLGLPAEPQATGPTTGPLRSQVTAPSEAVAKLLDVDVRGISPGARDVGDSVRIDDNSYRDEWGTVWAKPPTGGHYINVKGPFQAGEPTLKDLERHPWPDPNDPGLARGLRQKAIRLREETGCAIALNTPDAIFAPCQRLRGFGEFMGDMLSNPAFAEGLLSHVTEANVGRMVTLLKAVGDVVDIVEFPDDLGFQTQLQVSPSLYRRMVKPYHRKLVDAIKAHSKSKVFLHSDGSLYPLIKDLIEIGIEVLNPVQTTAKDMESDRLKREFGKDLSFWGAIDTQQVLPRGTPAEVEKEVARRISHLAKGGGYVVASCHNIQAEVPPENVVAMFQSVGKHGKYPLKVAA